MGNNSINRFFIPTLTTIITMMISLILFKDTWEKMYVEYESKTKFVLMFLCINLGASFCAMILTILQQKWEKKKK